MKPDFLLIGLGNPGRQYESTRHNIGYQAVDEAASEMKAGAWSDKPRFMALMSEVDIDRTHCFIVKPTTFMNRSGECVRKLTDFYKLNPATQILVCCDDIDLPLGTHRLRMTGGPGTHNGLKSIVECMGENFPRLRIGLGSQPVGMDLAAWVLSVMTREEKKALLPSLKYAISAVREVLKTNKDIKRPVNGASEVQDR